MLPNSSAKFDIVRVHLVDHDHPPQSGLFCLGEHAAGINFDARLGVDHDRRGIHAAHGADGLADEVGIAGRIDDVESLAGVIEMHHAGLDGVFMLFFFFVEVADAAAVVNADQCELTMPVAVEHAVDQRGFAR